MPNRPQPRFPEPNTETFWEGCQVGELRYQVNNSTGNVIFYPSLHDPQTGSRDFSWKVSKGEGTIYTFSVVRQNRMPNFIDLGAYSVAYIDLDEGFRSTLLYFCARNRSVLRNGILNGDQQPIHGFDDSGLFVIWICPFVAKKAPDFNIR